MNGDIREGRKRTSLAAAALLLGAFLAAASGCSSTVDEADQAAGPGGDASSERTPGATEPFPVLGSVPESPTTSTPEQRRELAEGLVSDRARGGYSDEATAFQGEPAAPLQPPEQLVTEAETPSSLSSQMSAVTPPFSGPPEASATPGPSPIAPIVPTPQSPPTAPPTAPPTTPTAAPSTSPPVPAGIAAAMGTPAAPERMAAQAVTPPFSGSTSPPPQPFPPPVAEAPAEATAPVAAPPGGGMERAIEPGFLGPTSTPPTPLAPLPATSAPATSAPATSTPATSTPAVSAPPPSVAAVSEPFVPPPPATASPSSSRAGPVGVEKTYQARLQESVPMGGTPVLPPTISPPADPDKPLVTVVVSSDGVESYKDRPVFLPELSPEPTRFDRFPSPGGDEPMVASTTGNGSVKVATILFEDGSARVGSRELGILRKVSTLHRQRGGTIRVVGHASSRTRNMDKGRHRSVNYGISVERASAVARELAKLGVPNEMIVVSALADEQPVYYEVMPSGEAGNRRAEIYIDY